MLISNSKAKGKRFVAIFPNGKRINFGQAGSSTYIDHGDKAKRDAYLARHGAGRENWNKVSPGALSRWLLWGESQNLMDNIASFKRRFSV